MGEQIYTMINLLDGTVFYGFKDEYISQVINNTKNYYEINDLQRLEKYIPMEPVVFDIGANIGNHTIYFKKHLKAKRVYSFEPVPLNADLLEKNIKVNELSDIFVYRTAVGSRSGKGDLSINEQNMGQCKLVESPKGNIPILAIDELDIEQPDFVKIDVEGYELEVLNGMVNILSSSSPIIWIEINERFHEVDCFLDQYDYVLIDKINFNHIYAKYDNQRKKLDYLNEFKNNIVPLMEHIVLEKWDLSKKYSIEKEKSKNSELERKRDKEFFNNEIEGLQMQLKVMTEDLSKTKDDLSSLKSKNKELEHLIKLKDAEIKLKEEVVEYKKKELELKEKEHEIKISQLNQKITELEQMNSKKIEQLELLVEEKNREILDRLDSEEETLKKYNDVIFERNQLEAKLSNISKKYELLSKAKLGKLTLKYWKLRKRIPQDF